MLCGGTSIVLNFHTVPAVSVEFDRQMYTASEAVASQNLAVFVCLTANTTERNFTLTLLPDSRTALGECISTHCP